MIIITRLFKTHPPPSPLLVPVHRSCTLSRYTVVRFQVNLFLFDLCPQRTLSPPLKTFFCNDGHAPERQVHSYKYSLLFPFELFFFTPYILFTCKDLKYAFPYFYKASFKRRKIVLPCTPNHPSNRRICVNQMKTTVSCYFYLSKSSSLALYKK